MSNSESQIEHKILIPSWGIAVMNVILLFSYLGLVMGLDYPDSLGAFLLVCHLVICIIFAIKSQRIVWWLLSITVAFPLISVLSYI